MNTQNKKITIGKGKDAVDAFLLELSNGRMVATTDILDDIDLRIQELLGKAYCSSPDPEVSIMVDDFVKELNGSINPSRDEVNNLMKRIEKNACTRVYWNNNFNADFENCKWIINESVIGVLLKVITYKDGTDESKIKILYFPPIYTLDR